MLLIHLLELRFDGSDPTAHAARYDSLAMRSFVRVDVCRDPVPDQTTVMRFRQQLKTRQVGGERPRRWGAFCGVPRSGPFRPRW